MEPAGRDRAPAGGPNGLRHEGDLVYGGVEKAQGTVEVVCP
jgi:hypothetical protein